MVGVVIDREREQRELAALANAEGRNLALIYGRRRVGKTYLLTHLWDTERAFYFTASAVTPAQNRERLVAEVAAWSERDLEAENYPTWRTVFRLLLSLKPGRPVVLILDEFQYLGEDENLATVASELNAVWEAAGGSDRPLLLVLAGSAVRILQGLDGGGAPLHGRFAWTTKLAPFDYLDASLMTPFTELRDRARAYAVFGGVPRYLAPVDGSLPLQDSVARLMLSPRGEVRSQVETSLLQEQGLRDTQAYLGILRAIGAGRTELAEIASRSGLRYDTGLRNRIERLIELDYISRERNFGAPSNAAWRHRLADPAFMFYHEFVDPLRSALETNEPLAVWREAIEPRFGGYMGHLFERIAAQAYPRQRARSDLPIATEWGRWEGTDRNRLSLEMDIVSRLADGGMLTGAIKWNRNPAGIDLHTNHIRDLDRLVASGQGWAHQSREDGSRLLYIAAGGFAPGFQDRAEADGLPVTCWTLADLYH